MDGPPAVHRLRLTIEPDTAELGRVRARLRRWLTRHGQRADEWVLVANELCANSMAVTDDPIELTMTLDAGELVLEVIDHGPGFVLDIADPRKGSSRSRGLWIVDQLTSRLATARDAGHTIVTAARPTTH